MAGFQSYRPVGVRKHKKYKYVYVDERTNGVETILWYRAHVVRRNSLGEDKPIVRKYFRDEREAAKAVDMALIRNGEPPVNVMKRL